VNKPTIFISYSHDSDTHRDQVLALSERLRKDGIETRLDRYLNGAPVEGWPRWMLNQLDEADFVLVVCTETYYRRFRGHESPGKGKGVDWEGALITQELYDARSATLKFAPVLFSDDQRQFIPEPLRATTHHSLTSESGYEALYDFLLSVGGFLYCNLLLGQGKHQEVNERAARTIEWAKRNRWLLDIALDNLSLGRAWLLQARQAGAGDYGQAAEFLQRAVDGLRQAGRTDHLPRDLLARAELRRVRGEYLRARTDLDEAQRLAERSQMGLHLADCHLEAARLCLATGEREEAREHWATAKAMVERMGYHRRDGEVAALKEELERLKVI
jgi:tetratricopeptide (TPR) repeat protein